MKNKQSIDGTENEEYKYARIGKFAVSNEISIDTIRYYIQLGLIHPIRKGRYFYFGKEQQEQLDYVIRYKALRFSLDEIKILMYTSKLRILETEVKSNYIENILIDKMDKLQQEKIELEDIISKLKDEIDDSSQFTNLYENVKGIAFGQLEKLSCPTCQDCLSIEEGILKNNSVYFGKITCSCGVEMAIEEGILLTSGILESEMNQENGKDSIKSLIESTSETFIQQMLYFVEEITRYVLYQDISSKTILCMKTGAGTLALNILSKCSEMGMLILFDKDLNQLKIAKKTIDKHFPYKNVLYISGSFNMLPIVKESVDLAIDFAATFDAAFGKSENLYQYLIPYMNSTSMIVGLYLYFKNNQILKRLESEQSKLLNGAFIRNYLIQNGYSTVNKHEEKRIEFGKGLGEFHQNGDMIFGHIEAYNK